MFFLLRTTLPGVARRLLTFLVSPRKVSKRSDRWVIAPFGGSRRRQAQIGKGKQLAALRHFSLLFPICTCRHRLLASGNSRLARCASPGDGGGSAVVVLRHPQTTSAYAPKKRTLLTSAFAKTKA